MKNYKTTSAYEAAKLAYTLLQDTTHQGGRILLFSDSIAICTGSVPSCDLEYCKEHGIMIFPAMHLGGTIVVFDGDLSIMEISYGETDFAEKTINTFVEYLVNLGLNVETQKNDVLVDGKKIASWARAANIDGYTQTVVHFSINVDIDLIKRICTKPMAKIPGALSDYNITAKDIAEVLEL